MAGTVTLLASVTQGAADAFAQATINTGLSAILNTGYTIKQIEYELPNTGTVATSWSQELALSRASKASMATLADDDLLFRKKFSTFVSTAAGFVIWENVGIYVPQGEIILIEEQIYLQFDSNASTLSGTAIMKITCEPIKVTDAQRIAILQSRVN